MIFKQASQRSRAAAMCVCRSWFSIAANELWRTLPSPVPLLSLLAPLRPNNRTREVYSASAEHLFVAVLKFFFLMELEFIRDIELDDWYRLWVYSPRIRELCYDDGDTTFDSLALPTMSMNRPVLHIAPYLETLNIQTSQESTEILAESVLFFSPLLTSLTFDCDLDRDTELDATTFIRELRRLPGLRKLQIAGVLTYSDEVPAMVSTLQQLRHLQSFTFHSSRAGIWAILEGVTWVPRLTHLSLTRYPGLDHQVAFSSSPPGQFSLSNLCRLGLDCMIPSIINKLFTTYLLDSIRELIMSFDNASMPVEPNEEIGPELFAAVARSCPMLELIDLAVRAPDFGLLGYVILEPIFARLRCLRELHIVQPQPLPLSCSDILLIARNLGPTIEVLFLNPRPASRADNSFPPALDLTSLLPIAQYCHKVRRLGIFVDATLPVGTSTSVMLSQTCRAIDFGASRIEDPFSVTAFLRGVLSTPLPELVSDDNQKSWDLVSGAMNLVEREVGKMRLEIEGVNRRIESLTSTSTT